MMHLPAYIGQGHHGRLTRGECTRLHAVAQEEILALYAVHDIGGSRSFGSTKVGSGEAA